MILKIIGSFIVIFSISYFTLRALSPYNDTDNMLTKERSGLMALTDNLTGCQYLKADFGGIIRRVDGNGQHVGCRK